MSDLPLLHDLQELDLRIEAQRHRLQEIEAALGETSELANARTRVQALQDLLHRQQQQLRELDWKVDELVSHAKQDEARLYSGSIRNPKELEGLRRDLEQRQAHRRELEDRELELMASLESTQADLRLAQEEQARLEALASEKNRRLLEQRTAIERELAALDSQHSELSARISAASLTLYQRLRKEKRGRAVSTIERSTCQGCRIALPMGLVQRVRAGRELVFCPSCGRILFT